jgi:hypothetical protein
MLHKICGGLNRKYLTFARYYLREVFAFNVFVLFCVVVIAGERLTTHAKICKETPHFLSFFFSLRVSIKYDIVKGRHTIFFFFYMSTQEKFKLVTPLYNTWFTAN